MTTLRLVIALVLATGLSSTNAQSSYEVEIKNILDESSTQCNERAQILADAQFSKWRKLSEKNSEHVQALNDSTYATVLAVKKQQCVSIGVVLLLREMKRLIPAEDAIKLNLDAEIKKHMLLIERSL